MWKLVIILYFLVLQDNIYQVFETLPAVLMSYVLFPSLDVPTRFHIFSKMTEQVATKGHETQILFWIYTNWG